MRQVTSTPPKPKESINDFTKRLSAAVAGIERGDCGPARSFNRGAGLRLPCVPEGRTALKGFRVTGAAAYGSGGIVEFTDVDVHEAKLPHRLKESPAGKRGVYVVAIGPDGRYSITGPVAPILPGPTIGHSPSTFLGFDTAAKLFVDAVRGRDCARFYEFTLTPGLGRAAACARLLTNNYGPLTQQLRRHPEAKAVRSGGTAQFAFYALRTGAPYRTLIVIRGLPGGGRRYLAMGTFTGPSS